MADHTLPFDLDLEQKRIPVAIGKGTHQLQPVARGFALAPELAARAAEKCDVAD